MKKPANYCIHSIDIVLKQITKYKLNTASLNLPQKLNYRRLLRQGNSVEFCTTENFSQPVIF